MGVKTREGKRSNKWLWDHLDLRRDRLLDIQLLPFWPSRVQTDYGSVEVETKGR